MKNFLLLTILFLTFVPASEAQQNYNDFEGTKYSYFGYSTGILDSTALNPASSLIDSSMHCARYIRDTATYDVMQIRPINKLVDVSAYASGFTTAKIKMKLYSSAPVGTQIQLQLGSNSISTYPAGVNSEYSAVTTVQNAWQDVVFNFSQIPAGSMVASNNVDKVVLLFHPNSHSRDTIYVDDLTGPSVSSVGLPMIAPLPGFKLSQNTPNPAKDLTHINFQLNETGYVSLKIYDMLGNPVSSVVEQNMRAGSYSIPVETDTFPNGIYFYVLKKEGISRSMKMIVSR